MQTLPGAPAGIGAARTPAIQSETVSGSRNGFETDSSATKYFMGQSVNETGSSRESCSSPSLKQHGIVHLCDRHRPSTRLCPLGSCSANGGIVVGAGPAA